MEKSKLEVIQDDILAVKHALANNIAYEGLQGDQLKTVLSTLFSQRAQQTTEAVTAPTSGGSGGGEPASSAAAGGPQGNGATNMSRVAVNGSRAKAVSAKKSSKKPANITTPATTNEPANGSTPAAASKDSQQTKDVADEETAPAKQAPPPSKSPKRQHNPAPRPAQGKKQASTAEKPVAKKRKTSFGVVLRELRKGIKVGDFVSVLGDVSLRGTWEKVWIKGEVVREMNRSGIFQIAFDHDRQGQRSAVKTEPGSIGEDERWIHEQRLSIEHPDFFCGQGDSPPIGIDNLRPKGAWYLHQGQGVSPPDMCSRTPRLSNGNDSGGHSSSSSSSSSSPATATATAAATAPVPDPVVWNQSSLGSDSVHGANSAAAAAGQSDPAVNPASGFLDL
ncbi:unnamed protein product [Ectocarpus sp. 12 AP-2014]